MLKQLRDGLSCLRFKIISSINYCRDYCKGSSKIYGLEHLDRGYENFESKLKILGIKIAREQIKEVLAKEYNISQDPEEISKCTAA